MKLLFALIAFSAIMVGCESGTLLTDPKVDSKCDVILEDDVKLSQNKAGKWAVIDKRWGGVLSYNNRYGTFDFMSYDSREADVYDDSCKAKGLYYLYINDRDKNTFK